MEHSPHERDGHRVGAHAVARDAAGGVGAEFAWSSRSTGALALAGGFAVACPRPIHTRQRRLMRRGPKPAKSKEAKPPVARKSPEDDARVRDLETRLAAALQREADASKREADALGKLQARDRELVDAQEQQTATSEVLRIIGSSTSDLQPVFDIIAKRATALTRSPSRMCGCSRNWKRRTRRLRRHMVR
jgi:hypothetical protein